MGRPRESFLIRDPLSDSLFEYIHWQCACVQHFIVESSKIKFVSKLILGILAQFENFELANFVAQSLGRRGDVAVSFRLNADFVLRGIVMKKVDDLLARPMFGMQAGVYNKPYGALHVGLQVPVVAVGILIKPY